MRISKQAFVRPLSLLSSVCILLLWGAPNMYAQSLPKRFRFSKDVSAAGVRVDPGIHYSKKRGFGFDLGTTGEGAAPFYFSVAAKEGNYQVTVQIKGDAQAAQVTLKAESRRLMLFQEPIQAGQVLTKTFLVNIKDAQIAGGDRVRLKDRELGKLDWDDKLTLEFDGLGCHLQTVEVDTVRTAVPTIFLAGNSTVVNQDVEPWGSWGQMIPVFFKPTLAIANHAESGLSLGSFLGSNRLKKVLSILQPGDYLFVEFGHNDQKEKGPQDGAYGSYTERLCLFVDEVRKKGGIPVIVTSTNRRTFDASGHITNSLGDYPDAARKVAQQKEVILIDLNQMTKTLYESLGPEASKKAFVHYPAHTFPGQEEELKDDTHFNTYGAYQIAQCVLQGIRQKIPGLIPYIQEGVPYYDPTKPDAIASWHWPESPRVDVTKPDGN